MNDLALAQLSASAYTATPTFTARDIHAVLTGNVLAFRGTTKDVLDWLTDIEVFGVRKDKQLGTMHAGFLDAGERIFTVARGKLPPHGVTLTGHSLGGALALVVGALMCVAGKPPALIVTFGAPRVGMLKCRKVLAHVTIREYRNGNDPVPDVPTWPYQHMVKKLTMIGDKSQDLLALDRHFIAAYIAALSKGK
jgi:predicted lipase